MFRNGVRRGCVCIWCQIYCYSLGKNSTMIYHILFSQRMQIFFFEILCSNKNKIIISRRYRTSEDETKCEGTPEPQKFTHNLSCIFDQANVLIRAHSHTNDGESLETNFNTSVYHVSFDLEDHYR